MKDPVQADHRFLKTLIGTMGLKVIVQRSDMDVLSANFMKMGGSWEKLFKGGDPEQVDLIRKVIKASYDEGLLTKKESWTSDQSKTSPNQS